MEKNGQSNQPAFLITVDTEGDNLWSKPAEIGTKNARFLPRFQTLCEKYGFRPTWLVNYEMAESPEFVEFGRDILARGTGEIGMHLHGWNSPPIVPLTENDHFHQPYLFEYPEPVMRDKIRFMTDLLEDQFRRKMVSHRAGRWGFDAKYARFLIECGYRVDCSATPHISWRNYPGDPRGSGGLDYSAFPEMPYFLDPKDISRPGDSPLLEIPVSVLRTPWAALHRGFGSRSTFLRRALNRILPERHSMLSCNFRTNGRGALAILRHALKTRWPCVELATHSSELMPGGSPFFPDEASIERLYRRLEKLFAEAAKNFRGMTLEEFGEMMNAE